MPSPDDKSVRQTRGIPLIALIFFSPLFFGSVDPWASMFFCAVVFAYVYLNPQLFGAMKAPVFILAALVMSGLFIRKVFSPVTLSAFEPLILALAYVLVYFIFKSFSPDINKKFMGLIIALCLFEVGYALFEVYSGQEMVLWRVKEAHHGFLTGTYFNRNHLASLLQLSLGCASGFLMVFLDKKRWDLAGITGLISAGLGTGLLQTGSRMGILSMGISLVALTGVLVIKRKWNLLQILVGFTAASITFSLFRNPGVFARFSDLEDPANLFLNERWIAWQDAFRMLKDHWVTGVGLGNFGSVFPQYQSPKLIYGWTHAHNGYLELAAEMGLPLFFIFSVGVLILVGKITGGILKSGGDRFLYGLGLLSGVSAFLLHGITDFNFSIPANVFVFLAISGACAAFALSAEGKNQ